MTSILALLPLACAAPGPVGTIPWAPSMPLAMERAAAEERALFVFFHAPWCGVCQRMKAEVFTDPEVLLGLLAYVPVSVDIDEWPHLAEKYHVEAVPMVAVLSPGGQILRLAVGGLDRTQLRSFLAVPEGDGAVVTPSPAGTGRGLFPSVHPGEVNG